MELNKQHIRHCHSFSKRKVLLMHTELFVNYLWTYYENVVAVKIRIVCELIQNDLKTMISMLVTKDAPDAPCSCERERIAER